LLSYIEAKAVVYGQLTGIPSEGTVTYVAYLTDKSFPPTEILTEDGFNSALGTNQGYQQGYFLLEKGNFTGEPYNNPVKLSFSGVEKELGKSGKTINEKGPNENLGTINFLYSSNPLPPSQPKAIYFPKFNFILLYWTKTAKYSKYLIYKSTLPSGADNNHSNGRYKLIGQTRKCYFLDKDIISGTAWYVIINIKNTNQPIEHTLDGHSEESEPIKREDQGAMHILGGHSEESEPVQVK